MIQSFYNGLSGMFNFSRGLDTISNNVANMNTPGFRGRDAFYRSLGGGSGYGTSFAGAFVRTATGEVRQTGNPYDFAMNGSGHFVLRDGEGKLYYTRAGQFSFRDDVLVDTATGYEVLAVDENGKMSRIDVSDVRAIPAQATTEVLIKGQVNATRPTSPDPDTPQPPPVDVYVNTVKFFDAGGVQHTIKLTMKWRENGVWEVTAKEGDKDLAVTGKNGGPAEIRYNVTTGDPKFGTPVEGFSNVSVALELDGGTQNVAMNFGEPGSTSGTRQSTTSQTLTATSKDGHAVMSLTSTKFDESGRVKLTYADTYSNTSTESGQRLALALFGDDTLLEQAQGTLYRAPGGVKAKYGNPIDGTFGKLQTGALELSNVDLTQEFADMMVVQRGYQASSRVMSVANEMVEQLYNNSRGG